MRSLRFALVVAAFGLVGSVGVSGCSSSSSSGNGAFSEGGVTDGSSGSDAGPADAASAVEGITFEADGTALRWTEQLDAHVQSDRTWLYAYPSSSPVENGPHIVLSVVSTGSGTFPCEDFGTEIYYEAPGSTDVEPVIFGAKIFPDAGDKSEGSCSITITSYGAVGEYIEGTFEGTLARAMGPAAAPSELTITNGRFQLRRSADR